MEDRHGGEHDEDKGGVHEHSTQDETLEMEVLLNGAAESTKDSTSSPERRGRVSQCLRRHLFVILNILGVIIGFALAFGLRQVELSDDVIIWLSLPGDIFLRLLKVTIVPLIVSNIIAGSAAVDPASNGRAGIYALVYNLVCNLMAAILGVLLAVCTKPGIGVQSMGSEERSLKSKVRTQDIFIDMIRNLVPDNLVRATMQKEQTSWVASTEQISPEQLTNLTSNITATDTDNEQLIRTVTYVQDVNILGLLFFCGVFGVAVGMHRERTRPIQDFFKACADVMLILLRWFVWMSPLGVCSLIVAAVVQVPHLEEVLIKVVVFFLVVTAGVLFQELALFPLVYFAVRRQNPYPILPASVRAWAIAFASSGSSCCMPEIFRVTERQGCDARLTSLTVPICVTLNATGSGLFIAEAVIFLAQVGGLTLTAAQYCVIATLTALSAMVLPSVPSASLVTVVMILTTLSIPTQHIGLLFTVEWFLDRIRTTCNVVCEIYGVILIDHLCKKSMKLKDTELSQTV